MKRILGRTDLDRLAQIVRDETGNQVQEKNFSMLTSRIQSRMMRLGLKEISQYWDHFEANENEEREVMQSLMTTHYTFFFREFAHFEVLLNWIDSEAGRLKKLKRPIRVWSAACSRGQEVYSLASFLEVHLFRKHGVPYEVVGTDIDSESVSYALNGVYPLKEVNTIPVDYLAGFWRKGSGDVKEFAAAAVSLRQKVKFSTLNLLEIPKWTDSGVFDVVFCRNVFIYFSEENIRKIAVDLAAKVDPRGLIVTGLSEPIRFTEWTYPSVGPSCYQKIEPNMIVKATPTDIKPLSVEPIAIPLAKYRVLCVDDSKTIQTLMKSIFKQDPNCAGVDTALNGREAREMLDRNKYDLITLDIHMPEVTGIQFLESYYKRKADPPVLMVSSVNRSDVDLATKALSLGAFDYVEKPAMNNMKKSSQEILTKCRMALRAGVKAEAKPSDFDDSIKRKIVVPDASQCLRVVFATKDSYAQLEQIVKGQENEQRSPALLIVWAPDPADPSVEVDLLAWTQRKVISLKAVDQRVRPNTVYFTALDPEAGVLEGLRAQSVSVQFLTARAVNLKPLADKMKLQILIDEKAGERSQFLAKQWGAAVSDITPATSFPSLSVEFFANLRKAA